MMGYFCSEHFTQMPFAEAYVDPHKMTYRARRGRKHTFLKGLCGA